jgi:geranylgeranyl diphosphate synthase, type II
MDSYKSLIEEALLEHTIRMGEQSLPSPLKDALHYVLVSAGKRVRGLMSLLVAKALGHPSGCLDVAVALEMIHAYSLVHDDLPCMDNDSMRRGRPTAHVAFDEATALLVGDALVTESFSVIASSTVLDSEQKVRIITELSQSAGHSGMIAGQALDLFYEAKSDIALSELERMHCLKTGKLFEAAWVCAAIVSRRVDLCPKLRKLGSQLGLCFQIQDDLLDGSEGTGKSMGKDEAAQKLTYLRFMSPTQAQDLVNQLNDDIAKQLRELCLDDGELLAFLSSLLRRRT